MSHTVSPLASKFRQYFKRIASASFRLRYRGFTPWPRWGLWSPRLHIWPPSKNSWTPMDSMGDVSTRIFFRLEPSLQYTAAGGWLELGDMHGAGYTLSAVWSQATGLTQTFSSLRVTLTARAPTLLRTVLAVATRTTSYTALTHTHQHTRQLINASCASCVHGLYGSGHNQGQS